MRCVWLVSLVAVCALISCSDSSSTNPEDVSAGSDNTMVPVEDSSNWDLVDSAGLDTLIDSADMTEITSDDLFDLTAELFDAEDSKGIPLTFQIQFNTVCDLDSVTVYLFAQSDGDPACADIDPFNLPFPAAKTASIQFQDNLTVEFPFFADLTPENPLRFTAVAVASTTGSPVVAFACDDENVLVEFGESDTVPLVIDDI